MYVNKLNFIKFNLLVYVDVIIDKGYFSLRLFSSWSEKGSVKKSYEFKHLSGT